MSVFRGVNYHLFHCLLNWCVCVISLHHQSFMRGYDFISPERIPTKRFCFFHSSFVRLCSIFLAFWVLSQHCGASNYMVFFFSNCFLWCSYSSYKQHSFSKASLSSASSARGAKYSRPGPEAVWLGSSRVRTEGKTKRIQNVEWNSVTTRFFKVTWIDFPKWKSLKSSL